VKGGLNTYGYVSAQPLTADDRLGLLIGFINCSQTQRSTIEQAEQKLRDFFRKHFACPKGEKCVEGNMAEMVLQKLSTNTVECSDFDKITSFGNRMGIWGADAPIGGDSTRIRPNLFRSPGSYQCFSAVLFHETMHTLGVEHTMAGPSDDDPVYGTVSKCVRAGLCGGGGP
jgi:hypothetical protein